MSFAEPKEVPKIIDSDIESMPDDNKILCKFKTVTGFCKDIYINPKKTLKDLIKKYFEKIKQPELYKDKDILILCSANKIKKDSSKKISEFIQENPFTGPPIFIVLDPKLKMRVG